MTEKMQTRGDLGFLINWPAIMESQKGKIVEAIQQAQRNALGHGQSHTGFSEVVELTADGKVDVYCEGDHSMSMGVANGTAIYIASFKMEHALAAWHRSEILQWIKGRGLRNQFAQWLVVQGVLDLRTAFRDDDAVEDVVYMFEEFRPDVWDELEKEAVEAAMDGFDGSQEYEDALTRFIQDYEIVLTEVGECRKRLYYWIQGIAIQAILDEIAERQPNSEHIDISCTEVGVNEMPGALPICKQLEYLANQVNQVLQAGKVFVQYVDIRDTWGLGWVNSKS